MSAGLDLFAAAWLERWQSFGGVVLVDKQTGSMNLQMPMPGFGGHREIEGEGFQRQWLDGFDTGRWRELEALIRLVPGGSEAVKEHVLTFPSFVSDRSVGV